MAKYGASSIKLIEYTGKEIKTIDEALEYARHKELEETLKKLDEKVAVELGISAKYLSSGSSNYGILKTESKLYKEHIYKIYGGNITGSVRNPKFHLKIKENNLFNRRG